MAQGRRLLLHSLLESLLGNDHVYHQPPSGAQMQYPCIVYRRDDLEIEHADNIPYRKSQRWQVTVIDKDPDSDIPDKISDLPLCAHDRSFATSGLNHHVYNLFF